MKSKKALEIIRKGCEKLAEAVKAARADIAAVEAREELTEEAKRSAVAARRNELKQEADAIKADGDAALATIREAEPRPARTDAVEAERIWRRQRRRLDSGEDPLRLAKALVDAGDEEGLRVLQEELPDHLRAEREDPQLIRATLDGIRAAEAPLLTGDRAEHREVLGAAEAAAGLLSTNAGLVSHDLETTEQVFGLTTDETITIKD